MWGREIKYLLLDKLNKIENLLNLGRDSRFLVTYPSARVAREAESLICSKATYDMSID